MNLSPLLLIHLTMKKYFQNYVSMGILHFLSDKTSGKVFRHTAAYDALIAQYLTDWVEEKNRKIDTYV